MTVRITDTTLRDARQSWLIAGIIPSGLAIAVLGFMPWLQFTQFAEFLGPVSWHVSGDDVYGMTALGDGKVVGALATAVIVLALASFGLASLRQLLASGIAITGFVIFGIALYDALYDWGSGRQGGHLNQPLDVEIAVGLWLTLALGLTIGIAGLVLTGLSRGRQEGDESTHERAQGWA